VFSWKTGEIEQGRIHNPHYIEFLRRQKIDTREVGDMYCGGIPDIRMFMTNISINLPEHTCKTLVQHHQLLSEFVEYDVDRLRQGIRVANIHRYTQIRYVAGLIDDTQFERQVCAETKKHTVMRETLGIFEVMLMIMTEQITHVCNYPTMESASIYMEQVMRFLEEQNTCCAELAYIYKNVFEYGLTFDAKTWELRRSEKVSVPDEKTRRHLNVVI
jgi:hypothetical protein